MKNASDNRLLSIVLLAVVMFSPMFVFQRIGSFDFWWWMSSNLVILIILSAILFRDATKRILADFTHGMPLKILGGIGSAVALYLVFLLGNTVSELILPDASDQVSKIYDFKGSASPVRVFLLMLLIIGPGEEVFWRAFLQERFMSRFGPTSGFILATILYTSVHVLTMNFMLIMAALIAGLFWGWMYMKYRSVAANVISHVIWDIAIFLLIPIGG